VIRVELNRIDETLVQLRREGPAEWDAEREVASHMFSEIESNWKRKDLNMQIQDYCKAMTDTKIFFWKAADLEKLFGQDHELGLLFMKRIAKIIKTRLLIRNIQFLDICRQTNLNFF